MQKQRVFNLSLATMVAVALVIVLLMALQVNVALSQDSTETELEQQAALAAETAPPVERDITSYVLEGDPGPLFIAVDDELNNDTFRVDVINDIATPAFSGTGAYGAAYDPIGDRVLFNDGTVLYEWPVGGTVNMLGNITDGAGANLTMVGLAYYNGVLYATRNIANEAVYEVDTTTLVATVFIDYEDADFDFGGFAIDPDTGTFYGTSDDTSPLGSGLYQINMDGTGTLIADYPAGETDIDGLSVGDGNAYLVIDEPGSIYVYDLTAGAYVTPLTAPWAGSEIFSAGAWIAPPGESISLDKTVGTDPSVCATEDEITVFAGRRVYYCYTVTNSTSMTLNFHDLDDSELGTLLTGFNFPLVPQASVFITDTAQIFVTTVNTATWTACNDNPQSPEAGFDCGSMFAIDIFSDTDTATVNILGPNLVLTKTVGTDPATCAPTDEISVSAGTDVYYCYTVTNTGGYTWTVHDLDDSELGTILSGFPFTLTPQASVFVTAPATIVTDTVNLATWTACNLDGPSGDCSEQFAFGVFSATDTATVTLLPLVPPAIVVDPETIENKQLTNEMTDHDLDISNVGEEDLMWTIDEQPAFVPEYVAGTHADSAGAAPAEDFTGFTNASRAVLGAGPTMVMGSEAANNNYINWVTSDPTTLNTIVPFATAGFAGAGVYQGGLSYIIDTANNVYVLDAAGVLVDQYTTTAPPGAETWAGAAIDPTTGNVYASSTDVATSSICDMDLATGTASNCMTIVGSPGHIGLTFDMAGNAYGYDIVTDQFMTIDPATGLTSNVVALPFDANFGQGIGTDPATGLLIMTAFNNGAFQPEYWSVDVTDPTTPVFNFVGVLGSVVPGGLAQVPWVGTDMGSAGPTCDNIGDIPWASVSPTAGTTMSGTTDTVVVSYDSTGLPTGVYTGTLCVNSNDPQMPLVQVPLVLTISVPTDVTMTGLVEGSTNAMLVPALTALVGVLVLGALSIRRQLVVKRIDD